MRSPPFVQALYRYPVKGCAGIAVRSLELDEIGPVDDRRWMIVGPDGETFLTQRTHPSLSRVRVEIDDGLVFTAPKMEPLVVPVPGEGAPRREVRIWDDRVPALEASDEASAWLSEYVGEEAVLVHLPDDIVRPVARTAAVEGFPSRVSFADGYPLLVLGRESVMDLQKRLPDGGPHVGEERFRPNIVVKAEGPWSEDGWRRIRIGRVVATGPGRSRSGEGIELRFVEPCARCVAVTVDPDTGAKGREPLTTLADFRSHDGKVYVGQNAIHDGPGVLTVGDPVRVLERGAPRPPIEMEEVLDGDESKEEAGDDGTDGG